MLREILIVEPFKYKPGSVKRGGAWTQIADILNGIDTPSFRVTQRSVRDRFNTLEKAFKKKMSEEEKGSGIAPPDLTDNETAIQEIIEKSIEAALHFQEESNKENADKEKAEQIRLKALETFSETRKRSSSTDQDDESPKSRRSRSNGSETVAFLKVKAEKDADLRQEEIRLKSDEIQLQRDLMKQQQHTFGNIMNHISQQQKDTQQQQQQMLLAQMQAQQQQAQILANLIEKLNQK